MRGSLSRGLLINTLWSFIGRFGYLAVGLAGNIILARLLSPTEFGQAAITMFFIVIASILIESGLSGALVRKQDAKEIDFSTVFVFNLGVSVALTLCMIVSAEYVAAFYDDADLRNILIASSLVFIVNALRITQTVKLVKALRFKLKAGCEFTAILVSSLIGVVLAYKGAGVWALVVLQMTTSLVLTILLWIVVEPTKSIKFEKESFLQLYKFGVNTTLASLLSSAFDNVYQIVLAKYFSIQHSGLFYQAKKLQEMPSGILQGAMLGVVYSTLSKLQSSPHEFNVLYRNASNLFTIIIAMISVVLFCYADFIITLLYGDKWSSASIYLKFLVVAAFFSLQEMFNRVVFKIFDRTELILQLEVVKKLFQSGTIVYGVWISSIEALLLGFVIVSFVSFLFNYFFARKIQGGECWKDFFGVAKITFCAGLAVGIDQFIKYKFSVEGGGELLILPLTLSVFVLFLHLFHVIKFPADIKRLLLLLRGQ